jgi:hypothetical protein
MTSAGGGDVTEGAAFDALYAKVADAAGHPALSELVLARTKELRTIP